MRRRHAKWNNVHCQSEFDWPLTRFSSSFLSFSFFCFVFRLVLSRPAKRRIECATKGKIKAERNGRWEFSIGNVLFHFILFNFAFFRFCVLCGDARKMYHIVCIHYFICPLGYWVLLSGMDASECTKAKEEKAAAVRRFANSELNERHRRSVTHFALNATKTKNRL